MTSATNSPGPRDGLDEGSLADLAQDGREMSAEIDQPEAGQPSTTSVFGPIDVPQDTAAMIDGIAGYGM